MEKVKGMSLFQKTGLLAFCLFGVISMLTSGFTALTMYERMTAEYVSKGSAIAAAISGASQEILLVRDAATVQSMIDQYLEIEGVAYVYVLDGTGMVVSHTFVPAMPKVLKEPLGSHHREMVVEKEVEPYGEVLDICAPVLAGVAGYVHVGMAKEVIMSYFWKDILELQVLFFFIFWGCVGILYLVSKRISQPLTQLTRYARRLAAHDFSASIDIRSRDELEVLGRSMQSMGQELALLFSEMEHEVDKATGDLRENMAYLSAIIDNLADGLLVVSPEGRIALVNPSMREFYGLDGDRDFTDAQLGEVFPGEIGDVANKVRNCSDVVVSAEVRLSNNRIGKAVGSSISVAEPSEQCLGGVILIRDITHEKELDQLKTDFISTVSHELRTPMTSVLGFAKIIKKKLESTIFPALDGKDEVRRPMDQVRGNVEIIVTEAERLTDLINDVLDIARMEAGAVNWREQDVSMVSVVRQSRAATRGLWQAKGLDVELEVQEDIPNVQGDYDRLVQVVVNLISNATKFTRQSPILCRVWSDDEGVTVSVTDRGAGIAEKDLKTIFDKFKQVGDTLTEKPTGTGLGLPISRQIVEYHGGRIWVESERGEGSTFTFFVPFGSTGRLVARKGGEPAPKAFLPDRSEPVSVPQSPEDYRPLVLVVDDDPALTSYLAQVFQEQGFGVREACNGDEAVRLASEFLPDLITMDIMMPVMDGTQAIRRLRENPATINIPILVISALSEQENVGGDMTLTKPVGEESLLEAARALLGEKDLCRSCLVMGEKSRCDLSGLAVLCKEEITFSSPEAFWEHVEKGFTGTIFIPAEESGNVQLERLSRLPGVSIVILPPFSCG